MERKIFLKNSVAALGLAFVAPLLKSCAKETIESTDSTGGTDTGSCEVSPSETAALFLLKLLPALYHLILQATGQEFR